MAGMVRMANAATTAVTVGLDIGFSIGIVLRRSTTPSYRLFLRGTISFGSH
jgi:hypothetical protein